MSAIGKGDWVECVRAYPDDSLKSGALYRVHAIESGGACRACAERRETCPQVGLLLAEADQYIWCVRAFRPIYRPKADLINSLKQPIQAEFLDEAAQVLTPSLG